MIQPDKAANQYTKRAMAGPVPSNISFKIRGKDSYFRFSLPNSDDIFQKLLDGLKEREIPFLKLFWIDDEGDRIALRNQTDMKDVLLFGKELIRLEAELQPEILVQDAPQPTDRCSSVNRIPTPVDDFVIIPDSNNNGRDERHKRRRDRILSRSRTLPYGEYVPQPFYSVPSYPQNDCRLCRH